MQSLVVTNHQERELHKAGNNHQRIADVAGQAEKHFQLYPQRQRRMPDATIELEPHLQDAFGPTSLLCFESIDLDWNFRWRFLFEQVNKSPAHQLCAKA